MLQIKSISYFTQAVLYTSHWTEISNVLVNSGDSETPHVPAGPSCLQEMMKEMEQVSVVCLSPEAQCFPPTQFKLE